MGDAESKFDISTRLELPRSRSFFGVSPRRSLPRLSAHHAGRMYSYEKKTRLYYEKHD